MGKDLTAPGYGRWQIVWKALRGATLAFGEKEFELRSRFGRPKSAARPLNGRRRGKRAGLLFDS